MTTSIRRTTTVACPTCGNVRDVLGVLCGRAYRRTPDGTIQRQCRPCANAARHRRINIDPRPARTRLKAGMPTSADLIPAGDLGAAADPLRPTQAQPGSEAKILILQARVAVFEAGDRRSIFLPGDLGTVAGYSLTAARVDDERGAA